MSELSIEVRNLRIPEPTETDLLDLAYAFNKRGLNVYRSVSVAADILEVSVGVHLFMSLVDYTPKNHIEVSKELADYFSDYNRLPN